METVLRVVPKWPASLHSDSSLCLRYSQVQKFSFAWRRCISSALQSPSSIVDSLDDNNSILLFFFHTKCNHLS